MSGPQQGYRSQRGQEQGTFASQGGYKIRKHKQGLVNHGGGEVQPSQSHKGLAEQDEGDPGIPNGRWPWPGCWRAAWSGGRAEGQREGGRAKGILERFAAREGQLVCILEGSPASSAGDTRKGGRMREG